MTSLLLRLQKTVRIYYIFHTMFDFTPLSTKIRILMQKSPRNSKIELSPNSGKKGTITASRYVLRLETQKGACILI